VKSGPLSQARVVADYQAPYTNPIAGRKGESVLIDGARKTDCAGWVWGVNASGQGGWVPEAYLERQGDRAWLRCDYDAIELTVRAGERLTVHKTESGFCWVTHEDGRHGWVPATHVERQA
jgi:uncharacterized protein YgiM (DUF1202 family)